LGFGLGSVIDSIDLMTGRRGYDQRGFVLFHAIIIHI
jgi:hypothetical protein